ncbi:COG3650 family protein [Novosphingobium sp. CECT 9465]|uniref:COG3650 family protein n=1 Tax=Novosphingobium sp. CECT 9465 TaxID=2829794 RepID=UPI001E4B027E|nr:hypothetical protein [Novosphingobium sp. CECT 9465]
MSYLPPRSARSSMAQFCIVLTAMVLGGCSSAPPPAPPSPAVPATFTALGTEPFWSARIDSGTLAYATPDAPEPQPVPVKRREGEGKATFTATAEGKVLVLEIAPGTCSDGMSDAVYPMTAIRRLGEDVQRGCAR